MADDVNKSGKPVNSASSVEGIGASRRSQSIDEVMKRAQQSVQRPIGEMRKLQQRLSDLRQQRSNLKDELEYILNEENQSQEDLAQQIAEINEEYGSVQEGLKQTYGSLKNIRSTTSARVQSRVGSVVSRYVSPGEQESRVRMMSRQTNTLEPAIREATSRGYTGLEQRREQAMSQASGYAAQIEEAQQAGDMSRVARLGQQMQASETQAAVASKGLQYLKQRGQDPESRFLRAQNVADRAQSRVENEQIIQQAESGELRGVDEISKELGEVAASLRNLKQELNDGKISLEEFNEKAGEAADRYERLEKEESASGGGGYGGLTRNQARGVMAARVASSAVRGLTQFQQASQVDYRIAGMSNAAQLARQQNQQYDAASAAVGGDMEAANMLFGGFENAAAFQEDVATSQRRIRQQQVGAETADAAIGAYTGMKLVKGAMRAGSSLVAGRGGMGTSFLMGAAGSGIRAGTLTQDIREGVSEVQAGNAAYNAALQAQQEILRVPTRFRQRYRDFGSAMGIATRGAGADREEILNQMDDPAYVASLRQSRIGVDRANDLINQGIAQQGSDVFNLYGSLGQARRMEQMGLGTMEQQFGRMGQLANAGAGDPTQALVDSMEEAVSRGFDNSKAVGMMVDATVSLAQSGATTQLGIDATGGITELMGRALGTRDPNSSSALQIQAAQVGIQQQSGLLTNRSLSFGNMARDTRLRQLLGDPMQAANAATLTAEQLQTLQGGGENAERLAYTKGLTGLINESGGIDQKMVKQLSNIQRDFAEFGGAGGVGYAVDPKVMQRGRDVLRRLESEGKSVNDLDTLRGLSKEDREAVGALTGTRNLAVGGQGSNLAGLASMYETKGDRDPNKLGTGRKTGVTEDLATGDTQVGTSELIEGMKKFGKDVQNLGKLQEIIEKGFVENIDRFGEAAAKSVENMRNDVNTEVFKKLGAESDALKGKFETLGTTIDNLAKRISGVNFDPGFFRTTTRSNQDRGRAKPEGTW